MNKTKIPISPEIIQLTRDILLSENTNISLKDVMEIKKFFSIIDIPKYTNIIENISGSDYLMILSKLIDNALENNTTSKTITIQSMLNESKYKDRFQIMYQNRREVSNEDIKYVKKFMSDHVSASFIFFSNDKYAELSSRISSGDYESISKIVDEYREFISSNYRVLNETRVKQDDERLNSNLDLDSLINLSSETLKELSTPGYYLNTGLENLDNAMGGGLKRGTLTLFGAKTSGFKSGIMFNLACSIKLFSKEIETFDKTKKPCIVYLSLENTPQETFKRLVSYTTNYTVGQYKTMDPKSLAEECLTQLNPDTSSVDVQLEMMYKKSNTIDVNYLYGLISDIESNGYEVVSLFVDYLETMKSTNYVSADISSRTLAVEDVARELYNLAISKNIAVVSGYQLNRGAYDSKNQATGSDTLAHTGSSLKLATHADNIYVINKSMVTISNNMNEKQTIHYLRFDEAKQRSTQRSARGYFLEMFMPGNSFRLAHSKYFRDALGNKINFEQLDYLIKQNEEMKQQQAMQQNSYGYKKQYPQFQQRTQQNPYIQQQTQQNFNHTRLDQFD